VPLFQALGNGRTRRIDRELSFWVFAMSVIVLPKTIQITEERADMIEAVFIRKERCEKRRLMRRHCAPFLGGIRYRRDQRRARLISS